MGWSVTYVTDKKTTKESVCKQLKLVSKKRMFAFQK
ncbi:Protein of unknown function [Gryllus bimaculatus]|nr:Protein of unknown function [Gryllus bimaculatus]